MVVRDLYAINFQPVISSSEVIGGIGEDVVREQEFLQWAEVITLIYPIWWTGMPAIMKGYIDRVFSYGFAYKYVNGVQMGLLKERKLLSSIRKENHMRNMPAMVWIKPFA